MHDIHAIRQDPTAFDQMLGRRALNDEDRKRFSAAHIISIDERRRTILRVKEETLARRNALSKEIGIAKSKKDDAMFNRLMAQVEDDKASIARMEEEQKEAESELSNLLAQIPNLPLPEVPDGEDEKDNVEHHRFGAKREFAIMRKGGRLTPKGRELIIYTAQSDKADNSAIARRFGVSSSTVSKLVKQSLNKLQKPHLAPEDTFAPKQHFDLGESLRQMDFETAAKLSGARFVVLKKGLARLERALGQFFLDVHTSEPHDYTEIAPPLLVNEDAMFGTAQLPKFFDDQFFALSSLVPKDMQRRLENTRAKVVEFESKTASVVEKNDILRNKIGGIISKSGLAEEEAEVVRAYLDMSKELFDLYRRHVSPMFQQSVDLLEMISTRKWLIPTAEVPLTNLVRESVVDEAQLPMRLTACTPCFRAEAGAAGKDWRGMIRQHQFTKVELVSITTPEQSKDEQERMLACAEEVLKKLDLHYRVVTLCTGDMGFASQKTYDIEVWLPGQNMFREISSCSTCGEFQARRMNARYKTKEGRNVPVHTLNGSGVAVGRAMIAVMETYQQEDGSIAVPDVLQPYMGGMKKIEKSI